MTNIRTIITQLDGLRERATQGEWKFRDDGLDYGFVGDSGKATVLYGERFEGAIESDNDDANYIVALHNSYESLRRAALAGEALAEAIEGLNLPDNNGRKDIVPEKIAQLYDNSPLGIFNFGLNEANRFWREHRNTAVATYRKAIEE